jgi:hypothetical protein
MSITISSVRFQDEYTGQNLSTQAGASDTGSPVFMGSVGDRMLAIISGYLSGGSSAIPAKFTSGTKTIQRLDTGSFLIDEMIAGDTITIIGSTSNNSTFTISVVTTDTLTVAETITTETAASIDIHIITPVESTDVYYNCSSTPSLVSLTDTATQKLSSDSEQSLKNFTNAVSLYPTTKSTAWTDDAGHSIVTFGALNNFQRPFTVEIFFFIKPFFLSDQLQSLQELLGGKIINPPSYFRDMKCLNFNYRIDAKYKAVSAIINHTSKNQTVPGNTGWFNEFLNGSEVYDSPYYDEPGEDWELTSITYKDSITNTATTQPDYTRSTEVTIVIKNTGVDTSAGANAFTAAPFVLNFMWLPLDSTAYQNQRFTVVEPNGPFPLISPANQLFNHRVAFLHDRAFSTVAAASVNGDRFGSDYQAIANLTSVVTGGSEATFTFSLTLGAAVKNTMITQNKDYMIWLTPSAAISNGSNIRNVTTLEGTDRNAVLCDVNVFTCNTNNSSLLNVIS